MTPERITLSCFYVTFVAAVWGYFLPRPYALCMAILIALPWLAITAVVLSHGHLRMVGKDKAKLGLSLIFPGIVLGYRGFHDLEPATWGRATLLAFATAALLLAVAAVADPALRVVIGLLIALPFVAAIYGFGAVLESNMLLYSSERQHFTPLVLDREKWRGRRNTTFRIKLAPWGSHMQPTEDFVDSRIYYPLETGTRACVDVGAGALLISWYTIKPCVKR